MKSLPITCLLISVRGVAQLTFIRPDGALLPSCLFK